MKKAILSKKDQVLHKLVLYEVRENSHLLDKFITEEQLKAMYDNMVWVEDNHIFIRNITDMVEYKRLSFFYETIIHDFSKKYRISEDQVKIFVTDCNTLGELKDAIGYSVYADLYEEEVNKKQGVTYEDTPIEEVGYRSSL